MQVAESPSKDGRIWTLCVRVGAALPSQGHTLVGPLFSTPSKPFPFEVPRNPGRGAGSLPLAHTPVRDETAAPVSRILFYAIISLGTYQTIDALLTGSGLFGLHPPRS